MNNPMDTYTILRDAFDHFNAELFNGKLSESLILLQRKRGAYGYFWANKLGQNGSKQTVHEIALNPSHIRAREPVHTFGTLAHEMVHQLQQEHGKPPKGNYHNKQWAVMMKVIGLQPDDGQGNETGRAVSHKIVDGGPFAIAYKKFAGKRDLTLFGDAFDTAKKGKVKTSKFKFECPGCGQNAWAKQSANLTCGDCSMTMDEA